jgi:hypothetical protein
MITDALLFFITLLLEGLISLLPSGGGFPSQVDSAIINISSYFHSFDDLVPMNEFFIAISFLITINLALFIVWSTMWVFNYIRGN